MNVAQNVEEVEPFVFDEHTPRSCSTPMLALSTARKIATGILRWLTLGKLDADGAALPPPPPDGDLHELLAAVSLVNEEIRAGRSVGVPLGHDAVAAAYLLREHAARRVDTGPTVLRLGRYALVIARSSEVLVRGEDDEYRHPGRR